MGEQHKSKIVWVLFIIIIALVGLNIYQYYLANNLEVDTEVAVVETSATPTTSATTSVSATPTTTATPNPTADWKTYTNTKYNYSISYPNNDWSPVVLGMTNTPAESDSNGVFVLDKTKGDIYIIGVSNNETRSLEDLAILSTKSCNLETTIITKSNVTINGISGIKITYSGGDGLGCATDVVNNYFSGAFGGKYNELYLLKSNNNFAEIALTDINGTGVQTQSEILNTFQFTK